MLYNDIMKHIIPVLNLALACLAVVMSGLCLTLFILIDFYSAPVAAAAFAVPALFLTTVLTALSFSTAFFTIKHRLSVAALIISILSAAGVIASFILMFAF